VAECRLVLVMHRSAWELVRGPSYFPAQNRAEK
jgi:hypothetical protein